MGTQAPISGWILMESVWALIVPFCIIGIALCGTEDDDSDRLEARTHERR